MHKRDLKVFKECCDVVYFPSVECIEHFTYVDFKKTGSLPPGCVVPSKKINTGAREIFYAGGVRDADGVDDLLVALDNINNKGLNIKFNLITKKNELVHIKNQELLKKDWIYIVEASGDELEPIYEKCDLGVIPRKRHFTWYGNIR